VIIFTVSINESSFLARFSQAFFLRSISIVFLYRQSVNSFFSITAIFLCSYHDLIPGNQISVQLRSLLLSAHFFPRNHKHIRKQHPPDPLSYPPEIPDTPAAAVLPSPPFPFLHPFVFLSALPGLPFPPFSFPSLFLPFSLPIFSAVP
jgi:hypothetical protein